MGVINIIKGFRYFNLKDKTIICKTFITNRFKKQPQENPVVFNEFIRIVGYLNSGIRILSYIDGNFLIEYKINGVSTKSYIRNKTSDSDTFRGVILWGEYNSLLDYKENNLKYIIDAGANIGFTSLFLNRHFADASIVAIEPDNGNFKIFEKNIEINKIQNIIPLKRALWVNNDSLEITNDFADGREWSLQVKKAENKMNLQVNGITLNQIMEMHNFPYIDILKIDIEGAERELFHDDDFLEVIKNKVKRMIIEIHYKDELLDLIYSKMEKCGFEGKEIDEVTLFNKVKNGF